MEVKAAVSYDQLLHSSLDDRKRFRLNKKNKNKRRKKNKNVAA